MAKVPKVKHASPRRLRLTSWSRNNLIHDSESCKIYFPGSALLCFLPSNMVWQRSKSKRASATQPLKTDLRLRSGNISRSRILEEISITNPLDPFCSSTLDKYRAEQPRPRPSVFQLRTLYMNPCFHLICIIGSEVLLVLKP